MDMPGKGGMSHNGMTMKSGSLIETLELHAISGTDVQPNSTPSEMLMWHTGSWTLMFHGELFLNNIQQTGPRGTDEKSAQAEL
jgi:hypothetical protein